MKNDDIGEGREIKLLGDFNVALSVTNVIFCTKKRWWKCMKFGSKSCDHLFAANGLFNRINKKNFCGLQSLNIVSKRSTKLELNAHVLKNKSPLQLLKVQVTQKFNSFYYLHNLFQFISNDLAESNILKNYLFNGYFIDFNSPGLIHPRFQSSKRTKVHDVALKRQD